ncbi:hypothetical protein V6N13_095442 [Hibiscus sabdariffa]
MADEQVLDLYKVNGSQCGPEPKMWEGSNETIIADHLGLGAKNGRGPYGNIVNPTKTWTNVLEEKVNSGDVTPWSTHETENTDDESEREPFVELEEREGRRRKKKLKKKALS